MIGYILKNYLLPITLIVVASIGLVSILSIIPATLLGLGLLVHLFANVIIPEYKILNKLRKASPYTNNNLSFKEKM